MSNIYGDFQQLQLTELQSQNSNQTTTHGKLDTANTHHATNASKLTNIQTITDTKLSAIQNFLDKDHAQFHLAHHPTLSKGQDVKAVGEGLQQVLIYGKKPDGTLQPLETSGDRLLVDVLELNASGVITTSTALSSVQVCGYDDSTSKFKTLNVDSERRLNTFQRLENDVIDASLAVASGFGAGSTTSEIEIKSKPYKGKISVVIENPTVLASNTVVNAKFSTSSGGTLYDFDLSHLEFYTTGNCNIIIIKDFVPPFVKATIEQSSGGSVNYSVRAIY